MDGTLTSTVPILEGQMTARSGTLSGQMSGSAELSGTMWGIVTDYGQLTSLPELNGVVINGSKSSGDYHLATTKFATKAIWDSDPTFMSEKDVIYIYTDYDTDGEGHDIAGIKVGDGTSYLIDMPFTDTKLMDHLADTDIHVTAVEKAVWNNKINVNDYQEVVDGVLIFNRL